MANAARLLVATVGALVTAAIARAHGEPAAALSIVRSDDNGVQLVRLNEGLAVRTDEGFRFVCPAAWGEDLIAPALAIPEGPAIVGAASGLFVVDALGAVSAHPDPMAAAPITALSASSRALYALQSEGVEQRVVRVEAGRVHTLLQTERRWMDLVASEGGVRAVGLEGGQLHIARIADDGTLLAEASAMLGEAPIAVRAVMAGDTLYVIAIQPSLDYVLGRIEDGAWLPLHSARVIAGPIEVASGERYVALDGQLARFDDERVAPLETSAFVTCLRAHASVSYACVGGGLRAIDAEGLGSSLFELEQVIEPQLESVSSAQRELCTLQWQRYRIDLQVGLIDAGVEGNDAGLGDASTVTRVTDAAHEARTKTTTARGCSTSGTASFGAAWIALALALQRRAGRRA